MWTFATPTSNTNEILLYIRPWLWVVTRRQSLINDSKMGTPTGTPTGTSTSRESPKNVETKDRKLSASASIPGAKSSPAISALYKSCLSSYDGVQKALLLSTYEQATKFKYDRDGLTVSIQEAQSKFKAWAQNIAAFQSPNLRTSLDFRLKEATGIRERIIKILQELQKSLSEGQSSIIATERLAPTLLGLLF